MKNLRFFQWTAIWLAFLAVSARPVLAQNYEILHQDLDASRHGYTVMRVWGSHYDMGFAMGVALADDIETAWLEMKAEVGADFAVARARMDGTVWLPEEIEDELDGLLAGLRSVRATQMDLVDLKVLNALSDLLYDGCRSHACWGSYVQDPVKSLATRRLDFGIPIDMVLHHVLCAWEPDDGSTRWVNLAWPGYVSVVTGVNEYGTLVSLHDYNSDASWGADRALRSVATRLVLTGMPDSPVSGHLAWAEQALSTLAVVTGTFINYYAPEGFGGVFTCVPGGLCGTPRTPQAAYRNGEVLITTNSQTDGATVPGDGSFMDDYYASGGPKDLQSHFEVMGSTGLHLLSVAYRARGDMSLWVNGRDCADRLEIEWSELFPAPQADGGPQDAGPADAGTGDSGTEGDEDQPAADSELGSEQDLPGDESGGCGCASEGGRGLWMVLVLMPLWVRKQT